MKVLVIEDEPISRHILSKSLKTRGHEVFAVASAEEAIPLLHETPFPLVFLDLGLPGINGLELGQYIRDEVQDGDQIYLIVGTSMVVTDGEFTLSNILATADDFIPKPYSPERLSSRLVIAERKIAELEREIEHEKTFIFDRAHRERLIEASSSLVMVLDYTQHVMTLNHSCSLYFGELFTRSQFPQSFCLPEYWPDVEAELEKLRETSQSVVFRTLVRNSKNEEYFILWTASIGSEAATIVCFGVDITDRFCEMERPKSLAVRDPLTSLYNGNYVQTAFEEVFQKIKTGLHCVLIEVDLDTDDNVDTFDRDKLLVNVANMMKQSVRTHDIILRTGCEFLIFLCDVSVYQGVEIAERIRVSIGELTQPEEISPAIGIVELSDSVEAEILLGRADEACHVAKTSGKFRVETYREPLIAEVAPVTRQPEQTDLGAHIDSIRHLVKMGFTAGTITQILNETFQTEMLLRDVQRFIATRNLRPMLDLAKNFS